MRNFVAALVAFSAGFFVCHHTRRPHPQCPPPPEVRGAVLVNEYGAAVLGFEVEAVATLPNEDGGVRVIVRVTPRS